MESAGDREISGIFFGRREIPSEKIRQILVRNLHLC